MNHSLPIDAAQAKPAAAGGLPGGMGLFHQAVAVAFLVAVLLLTYSTNLSAQAVCDRTPQVRDKLVEMTGASNCSAITWKLLEEVKYLELDGAGITTLQSHDFTGLSGIRYLHLDDNSISVLPQSIFRGLRSLENLRLERNSLSALPEGVFARLQSLEILSLSQNSLTTLPEQIFAGLSKLESLYLYENSISALPDNVFSGLDKLEQLWLRDNSLSSLPPGVFRGLSSLRELLLGNESLSALPVQIFAGLGKLEELSLSGAPLSSLPPGIFRGLSSLRVLSLDNNRLNALPEGIFHGLDNLESLSLAGPPLPNLPAGIFDDVLDTLGRDHRRRGLSVFHRPSPPYLAFAATAQSAIEGTRVKVGVFLSRPLPLAVRVPYSVGGTATPQDFTNLTPSPDSGLLFLAGETSKDISFTLSEDHDSREETILLTLGELALIGLRRSDGTGPDAPYLKAETLLRRPADRAVHTVTVAGRDPVTGTEGICDRTPQIRDKLVEMLQVSHCGEVTPEHLAGVNYLNVHNSEIGALQAHDFRGMSALKGLDLHGNSLSDLPRGVFNGLHSLQSLGLSHNALSHLPDGVFRGLGSMQNLNLTGNRLSFLNEETFTGMSSLKILYLGSNLLTTLPEGLFRGLSRLEILDLQNNSLIGLPARIFSGLKNLESLQLYGNLLNALPGDVFDGLSNLETLELSRNFIDRLPAQVFRGLGSLRKLGLDTNFLKVLPVEIFSGLENLETLDLNGNRLQSLPKRIFDDVLDTLGRTPEAGGLSIGSELRADLAFASTAQDGIKGASITATVVLDHALPVAVHVPYSVGGTATPEDYTRLSPPPDTGLLFLAGETSKEIVFTPLETDDNRDKTVLLTLANLSDIGVRRSDGTGPDAPYLKTETLLQAPSLPVIHTVTVLGRDSISALEGVCGRTPQVRDSLVEATGVSTCDEVTVEQLAGVAMLQLSDSNISTLQVQDFNGLSGLKSLWLNNNSLRNLPEGIFNGLGSLEHLWLHGNLLSTLPAGLFSGLSSLRTLHLFNNSLSDLPEGIFSGLSSLGTLHLYNNRLNALPVQVFRGLSNLERLELWGNSLRDLPIGVFDDVLDTLGTDPGYEEFLVDADLMPSLAFIEAAQKALKGTTVRTAVTLSRHLPVAVRVPYTLGGSATTNDYTNLSPTPEAGLLFLAGETRKEISFSLLEENDSNRETMVLTLGEISRIGLRSSDGTGPDAPNLRAASLLLRSVHGAVHTVTVSGRDPVSDLDGVCGRTPQVRDKLMEAIGVSNCEEATDQRLASVTSLELQGSDISALQENDFAGLSSLKTLNLYNNNLSSLPRGIFRGLGNLEKLYLDRNGLSTLPEGVFSQLGSLTTLWLNSNRLNVLPQGVFSGLSRLEWLRLTRNSLSALPEGAFSGLNSLEVLTLTLNSLTDLPQGIFSGLNSLKELRLGFNSLTSLRREMFSGVSSLEWLSVSGNSLTDLPVDVFSGLPGLRVLRLGSNSLGTLSPGVFHGLTNLEWLDLAFNSLTELPAGSFSRLSNLKLLDLLSNSLSALPTGVFNGLQSLEVLRLNSNSLSTLPDGVFRGLRSLQGLEIQWNSLTALPKEIFSELSSLEILWLTGNSLSVLPEKSFHGLTDLRRLWLDGNSLTSLSEEIFKGLNSIKELKLERNNLNALPGGVFDDMLGTLGQTIEPFEAGYTLYLPFQGGLHVDGHLKAHLGFAATTQRVAPGSTVEVPVTLSRMLPVAVRVPYTVGFSGSAAGLAGLSPSPETGLLFRSGEIRREISFTLPEDGGDEGQKTLVLTLGKPSQIGLRRSDGSGPDAPHLKIEHLLDLSAESITHTIDISGPDPLDRDPFCLSLWEGSPCATVATLSPVMAGTQGNHQARTEVVITNTDPLPTECETALLLHQGTTPAPEILFDRQSVERNLLYASIPRGGAEILTLTAPDVRELSVGAAYLFTRSPCTAGSLHVRGNYLIEDPISRQIEELFSINGQSEEDWLQDGDCRLLTGVFGNGRNLEFAVVTTRPEGAAPPGARLRFQTYDLNGNSLGRLPSLEISGQYQVHSFPELQQPRIIRICLEVPGTTTFGLAFTAIGNKSSGVKVQYATERFPADPTRDEADPSP